MPHVPCGWTALRPWAPLGLLVFATACVPKGRHELVQVQLDATRIALSARQASCIEQTEALGGQVGALKEEVDARQQQLDLLGSRAALLENEIGVQHRACAEWARVELPPWPDPQSRRPPPEPPEVARVRAARSEALDRIEAALRLESERRIELAAAEASHAEVVAAFEEIVREDWGSVRAEGASSVVTVPARVLFQEGKVIPSPLGDQVMRRVAVALRQLEGRVVTLVGHTDDLPHSSLQYPSNWELGFGYATTVLRKLLAEGVTLPLSAASFAGTRPLDPAATEEARKLNRRVELVIAPDEALLTRFAPTPPEAPPAPEVPPAPETPPAPG